MTKNLLKILAITALTAVFIYFFARSVKWGEVLQSITNVNLPLFLLCFPLSAPTFPFSVESWRVMKRRPPHSHVEGLIRNRPVRR